MEREMDGVIHAGRDRNEVFLLVAHHTTRLVRYRGLNKNCLLIETSNISIVSCNSLEMKSMTLQKGLRVN